MTDIYRVTLAADSRDIRTAKREVDNLDRAGVRAQSTFRSATRTIAAFASALAIGQTFRMIIANTIEQERVTAQLEATLRSTGRYTPELSRSLQDYASELQKVSTFGDEAIISAQALLLTFTKVGGEAFPRATQAILDTATAMGQDLRSATIQIGRALNDPITGLTALTRSGIQFSDAQKDMIKEMVKVGDVAGAQTVILKELETQFGGSAKAARETFGGAIKGLQNAFGDLLEAKGGLPEAQQRIESLTQLLQDPSVLSAVDKLTSAMITGFSHAATGAAAANVGVQTLILSYLTAYRRVLDLMATTAEWQTGVKSRLVESGLFEDVEGSIERSRRAAEEYRMISIEISKDIGHALKSHAESLDIFEKIKSGVGRAADGGFSPSMSMDVPIVPGGSSVEAEKEATKELQSEFDWRLEIAANNAQRQAEELIAWEEYRINELRRLREEERASQREQDDINRQAQSIMDRLMTEEEAILASYQRRKEIMEASTLDTTESLLRLEADRSAQLAALDAERAAQTRQNYENMFGALAGLSKAYAGEQSGIYRTMFAVSKAFALADAIIKIQQGVANAAALPFPANLGAMATVVSSTAGIVSTISSTQPSFEGGGFTGYGPRSGGVDGRGGFPAVLHPNETVVDHTKGGGQQTNNTRIINVLDPAIVGDYLDTDAGEEIIMNIVKRNQGGA